MNSPGVPPSVRDNSKGKKNKKSKSPTKNSKSPGPKNTMHDPTHSPSMRKDQSPVGPQDPPLESPSPLQDVGKRISPFENRQSPR